MRLDFELEELYRKLKDLDSPHSGSTADEIRAILDNLATHQTIEAKKENSRTKARVDEDTIFCNIKKQIRQSNKIRVETYANTRARLVEEIKVSPLRLKQYSS